MCTAITFAGSDHYFGRTLDYEISFGESVVITPRNVPLTFLKVSSLKTHFAMIGMGVVRENYPLYFEATNEKGLSVAGLNFPGNAVYFDEQDGKENISPFEFIPWILGQCASVRETKVLLTKANLLDIPFSSEFPLSPLHWMISDGEASITVESCYNGLNIYDNPVGVLTNNPPFEIQLFNLNNYMHLSKEMPENHFSKEIDLKVYSRGMGALGLPGDLSSASRFVRACFVKLNSLCDNNEESSVSQFFHILSSVEQQRGCVAMSNGTFEITRYTSCCNIDKCIYYYTTYDNLRITAVHLNEDKAQRGELIQYPLRLKNDILYE